MNNHLKKKTISDVKKKSMLIDRAILIMHNHGFFLLHRILSFYRFLSRLSIMTRERERRLETIVRMHDQDRFIDVYSNKQKKWDFYWLKMNMHRL